jgi:hypothetical protein
MVSMGSKAVELTAMVLSAAGCCASAFFWHSIMALQSRTRRIAGREGP